jgi:hypothetical protein
MPNGRKKGKGLQELDLNKLMEGLEIVGLTIEGVTKYCNTHSNGSGNLIICDISLKYLGT